METVGPRNMVHSWASDQDDATEMPRWGEVGKQKIEDAGPLHPKRMETVDEEILAAGLKFVDKARADGKPFFLWFNPSRMHVITHLSPKYEAMRNSKNGWSIQEAGMARLDDNVGAIMQYLKDNGLDDDTIVMFTTDNGPETFSWPDGGQTPFYGCKGTGYEGGFRCPAVIRWPGQVPAGTVENGIISGLDWLATFAAAAGNPNIVEELKKGKSADAPGRRPRRGLEGFGHEVLGGSERSPARENPSRPAEGGVGRAARGRSRRTRRRRRAPRRPGRARRPPRRRTPPSRAGLRHATSQAPWPGPPPDGPRLVRDSSRHTGVKSVLGQTSVGLEVVGRQRLLDAVRDRTRRGRPVVRHARRPWGPEAVRAVGVGLEAQPGWARRTARTRFDVPARLDLEPEPGVAATHLLVDALPKGRHRGSVGMPTRAPASTGPPVPSSSPTSAP